VHQEGRSRRIRLKRTVQGRKKILKAPVQVLPPSPGQKRNIREDEIRSEMKKGNWGDEASQVSGHKKSSGISREKIIRQKRATMGKRIWTKSMVRRRPTE